eukprot:TRINITY_DN40_c0_g2_i2.p1 TRINITY_DN40_c0_g2~~TRINITY_DN40_c0_g2_i2.p1  ORF type:complete len:318 (+),score=77.06 TRINITY_DN40_c0_g2_i2:189-1142(+)
MKLTLVIFTVLVCATYLIAPVSAKSCTAQWECSEVGDYNYVKCGSSGTCECLSQQGFIGTAQPSDKCRCDKSVFWQNGLAYCIDLVESAQLKNNFAGLDFNGDVRERLNWFAGGSYTISGTYQTPSGATGVSNFPSTLAIDTENQFIYLNHVNNIHFLWPTVSQSVNGILFASAFVAAGRCYLSNYTSLNQVDFHKSEVWIGSSLNWQKIPVKQFVAKSFDHHVAEASLAGNDLYRLASFTEQTFDGIITHWTWDAILDVFGAYRRVPQSIAFNSTTLIRGTPDPNLVQLLPLCSTPGKVFWFSESAKALSAQVPLF